MTDLMCYIKEKKKSSMNRKNPTVDTKGSDVDGLGSKKNHLRVIEAEGSSPLKIVCVCACMIYVYTMCICVCCVIVHIVYVHASSPCDKDISRFLACIYVKRIKIS